MELMPIKESVHVFLQNNKENLTKQYKDDQIRAFYEIFEQYSTFYEDNNFYLTPIKILKMKEDVGEQVQQQKTRQEPRRPQQPTIQEEDGTTIDDDEDIKTLFEE